MGVSNGIITAPINIKDPYTCIGVGLRRTGMNWGISVAIFTGRQTSGRSSSLIGLPVQTMRQARRGIEEMTENADMTSRCPMT